MYYDNSHLERNIVYYQHTQMDISFHIPEPLRKVDKIKLKLDIASHFKIMEIKGKNKTDQYKTQNFFTIHFFL